MLTLDDLQKDFQLARRWFVHVFSWGLKKSEPAKDWAAGSKRGVFHPALSTGSPLDSLGLSIHSLCTLSGRDQLGRAIISVGF